MTWFYYSTSIAYTISRKIQPKMLALSVFTLKSAGLTLYVYSPPPPGKLGAGGIRMQKKIVDFQFWRAVWPEVLLLLAAAVTFAFVLVAPLAFAEEIGRAHV